MPLLILYILKFSISLAVVYLFYKLLLRRLTFHNCNRWYLLGYTLLCFFIPFINISPLVEANQPDHNVIISFIPSIETYTNKIESTVQHIKSPGAWDQWDWMLLSIGAGAAVLLLRFFIHIFSVLKLRRKAKLVSTGDMNLYHVTEPVIPFSFGNSVFINKELHSEPELQEIIRHEFVHVKQKHTIDIIWAELLCMLNWYNPFAWLLKAAIRQNLEFIADKKVLENGVQKKEYQYLLLKVMGNDQYSIAQKFNFSSLKKRIAMMNKLKTAKVHLFKFLFVLPLLTVLLVSFRNTQNGFNSNKKYFMAAKDTISPERLRMEIDEIIAFNNKNPEIVLLYSTEDKSKHIVFLRDGSIESYGYPNTATTEDLEKKYGVMPAIYKESRPGHSIYLEQWKDIAEEASAQFRYTGGNAKTIIFPGDSRVLVQLENNRVHVYDMDYDKDREQFERVFGKLPACVPPPSRTDNIPAEERLTDTIPDVNEKGYIIDVIGTKSNATVVVKDKNGKLVERISYSKWKENEKQYNDKYGELPPPPPPPLPPDPPTPPQPIELPDNVKKIEVNDNKKATVVLKDGTVEKYDLTIPKEKAEFEKKYGDIIPPPPTRPRTSYELSATQELNRSKIAGDMEIDEKKATMHLKDGTTEVYDLTKSKERKAFEAKYGEIIEVPVTVEGTSLIATTVNVEATSLPVTAITVEGKPITATAITVEGKPVTATAITVEGKPLAATAVTVPGFRSMNAPREITGVPVGSLTLLNADGKLIHGEEEVLVTITRKTTQQQLEDFVRQMKEKGIELKFDDTNYENGILMHISGTMKNKTSHCNFSATDFNKVILSRVKDEDHIFFQIRTRDEKEVS